MATDTFYLQNAASDYHPATVKGAWDLTTGMAVMQGLGAKSGTVTARSDVVESTSADYDVCLAQHVSAALGTARSYTGTIDGVISIIENDAGVNAKMHLHIWVTTGDSSTVRGTLLTDWIDADEMTLLSTTSGLAFSYTMTDVSAQVGDRVVLEVGGRCNAADTTHTIKMRAGGTDATDLTDGGDGTLYPGWIRIEYATAAASSIPSHSVGTGIGSGIVTGMI